jgi:GNAT acetyltransferase-like protein
MIQVGRLGQADVDAAAGILFDAFGAAYRRRGHAPPFPTRESAAWLCRAYIDLDPEGCALARSSSEVVGVGFAHPRGAVTSIGPLASRPGAPAGVARALMTELGEIAAGSTSIRLFQDSFNPDSFGLYTRLGYAVADVAPYLLAEKLEPPAAGPETNIRPLVAGDLPAVERYDRSRTGADRRRDLALLASTGGGLVYKAEAAGEGIAGYLFFRALPARVVIGPAVAESAEILAALVDGVAASLPGRAAVIRASAAAPVLLRRAFDRGFLVDHLGNLMVRGSYAPPPAQLYALFPESL